MATTKVSTKLLETVGVAEGGTGAVSAGAARTSLGLVIGTNVLAPNGSGSSLTGITTGATDAEAANIMLNAFRISVNGSLTRQNMVDGVVDEFEDETGIDTANSTGEQYSSTLDKYLSKDPSTQFSTSGLTPIGELTGGGGLAAAFDGTDSQGISACASIGDAAQRFIGMDWGSGVTKTVLSMSVIVPNDNTGHSSGSTQVFDFAIIGHTSDDPDSGTELGTSVSGTISNTSEFNGITYVTTATNTSTAYRYHWADLNSTVTAAGWAVAELKFYGAGPTADFTLLSNAVTALAAPTNAIIVIQWVDNESVTLNTDIKAWATREAGQTFTSDFGTDEKLDITGHTFLNDERVMVTSSSQDLPAGLSAGIVYFVVNKTANDFELSLTSGGSAVNITDNGTGTHTARRWVQGTLAETAALATGGVLTGSFVLSTLTSGTAMRYAIETLSTKEIDILAVSLSWS